MVVAQPQKQLATPSPMPPKRSRMPWRIGSRASKRVPALGGMKTDALGRAVVNGHEDKGWTLGDGHRAAVMSVPHITSGASVMMVPSCAFGPCA